ncbi:hypothetical protein M3936_14530 [Sutcliffiella horikoshii]|uniref:hypothetical protein n=1 Tax=Sutcliffiella horikoshii TaxID=79883 RepID=UPI0007D09E2B|nr:hypothetical protein [Sutcliffiella horikoshii]MCM3618802.1 hypothetical protein [Sutcliffiella horikoshii]
MRPRNEVRRLKVAPRKAKPVVEINSGIKQSTTITYFYSGLGEADEAYGPPAGKRSSCNGDQLFQQIT